MIKPEAYSYGTMQLLGVLLFCLIMVGNGNAQPQYKDDGALFTTPKGYTAHFTKEHLRIDGSLAEPAWAAAAWSELFLDIEGEKRGAPALKTRMKMLWNDSLLFVAAFLEEPHVWASLTKHDAIVYHDNDFEVFIDPDNNTHQYYEIEVNALNTIFDLFMPKPYRNGGNALIAYDVAGLQSAVKVWGTLNNGTDKDSGWSVELAIPFRSLHTGNTWRAPADGAIWRINFSRVQWDAELAAGKYSRKRDAEGKLLPEHNWVWSPQGVINMHFPERWGYLQFVRNSEASPAFTLPYNEKRRPHLWQLYYRQKDYQRRHGKYAGALSELGVTNAQVAVDGRINKLSVEATSRQFTVYISDEQNTLALNDEGLVQTLTKPL